MTVKEMREACARMDEYRLNGYRDETGDPSEMMEAAMFVLAGHWAIAAELCERLEHLGPASDAIASYVENQGTCRKCGAVIPEPLTMCNGCAAQLNGRNL